MEKKSPYSSSQIILRNYIVCSVTETALLKEHRKKKLLICEMYDGRKRTDQAFYVNVWNEKIDALPELHAGDRVTILAAFNGVNVNAQNVFVENSESTPKTAEETKNNNDGINKFADMMDALMQ